MHTRLLEEIGLTENESKVYISLLRLGSATAGEITEKSVIDRRSGCPDLSKTDTTHDRRHCGDDGV